MYAVVIWCAFASIYIDLFANIKSSSDCHPIKHPNYCDQLVKERPYTRQLTRRLTSRTHRSTVKNQPPAQWRNVEANAPRRTPTRGKSTSTTPRRAPTEGKSTPPAPRRTSTGEKNAPRAPRRASPGDAPAAIRNHRLSPRSAPSLQERRRPSTATSRRPHLSSRHPRR